MILREERASPEAVGLAAAFGFGVRKSACCKGTNAGTGTLAAPKRSDRAGSRRMNAMTHSTRLTGAMIGLVLLAAPALVLLAYRNIETTILLAGLAAILGVVVATVLMADALTRPLVEMADAVTTLARARTAEIANDAPSTNVVSWEPYAQRKRAFATSQQASGADVHARRDDGGATARQAAEWRRRHTPAPAVGSTIDIVIPSDRREQFRER